MFIALRATIAQAKAPSGAEYVSTNIPLLTERETSGSIVSYKHIAPDGAKSSSLAHVEPTLLLLVTRHLSLVTALLCFHRKLGASPCFCAAEQGC
ncbi:MAG TPA: hypothetical protein VF766_07410, partial [Pyrinomonadaceae bacterium]